MSNCECGRESDDPQGCAFVTMRINGIEYVRETKQFDDDFEQEAVCGDCGAPKGKPHHVGCDIERCAVCDLQALTCKCPKNYQKDYIAPEPTLEAKKRSTATAPKPIMNPNLRDMIMGIHTLAELKEVNELLKVQWNHVKIFAVREFKTGEKVEIRGKRGMIKQGTVVKANRTTVTVKAVDGVLWDCSPSVLTKVGA
jgi:hypothetical protein